MAAANAKNRDLRSVVNEIKAKVKGEVELPFGYFIQYGGQSILDFRFSIDPTDKCGGLRIFDFGLIPRINHVAGTTFEIRLSI